MIKIGWILYYFILILGIILSKKSQLKIVVLLTLSMGLRYRLGWDYDIYKLMFENRNILFQMNIEEGFKYYIVVLKYLKFDYQMLFFSITLFKVYILYRVCLYYRADFYKVYILYVTIPFFLMRDNSNLRQAISEAFFLLLFYGFNNSKLKQLIFIVFGSFFHKTIILLSPIIWIYKKNLSYLEMRKKLFLSIFIGVFGSSFIKEILTIFLSGKFKNYLISNTYTYIESPYLLSVIIVNFICYFYLLKFQNLLFSRKYIHSKIVIKLSFIGWILLFLSINLSYGIVRISFYLLLFYIIFIGILSNFKLKKIKVIINLLIILNIVLSTYLKINDRNSFSTTANSPLKLNYKILKIGD